MLDKVKEYDIGGVTFSLSEIEGVAFTRFLSEMSEVPDLRTMVTTDDRGRIVFFEPGNISWGLVFFIQNLMISQRLREIDEFLDAHRSSTQDPE